ncbi:MAG: FtsB family cell division protein [Gemmatimonadota bacterium]
MRLRRWLIYGGLAAAAYFALFGGEYGLLELRGIEREHQRTEAELDSLREEMTRMRARLDSLENDPAALERVARERYGMIRDGERLYRFVEGEAADSLAAAVEAGAPDGRAEARGDGGNDGGAPDDTTAGG